MKNMVKNYSEAEVKVREATSNDPWGPSSTLMSEISDLTYNIVALGEIMRMIWKRLNDHGKNWRHVYKSLVLLDYLIKNGNEKVAQQCKEHIVAIQTLKDFQYLEEQKDQGASVREKAKQLVNLLRDDERLKAERAKAFKARERFAQNAMGISSDNKMVFASRAVGGANRPNSSYADPYGGAASSSGGAEGGASGLAPELEAVRPSDQTEEELQLKLAIMLSQQEHEEEVQRKRADEAKLAIALEQSKSEGQPNGLVDIGGSDDPWGESNSGSSSLHHTSDPFAPSVPPPPTLESVNGDPWLPPPPNASGKHHHQHHNSNDPWATNGGSSSSSNSASATNPWSAAATTGAAASAQDDFDLFTSNRKASLSDTHQATGSSKPLDDPFGDFFGASSSNSKPSTNPWNADSSAATNKIIDPFATSNDFDMKPVTSSAAAAATNKNSTGINPTRKTPESFLGENSALVNLENLIPSQPRPKSTNPFGSTAVAATTAVTQSSMTASTSHGHLNNPFAAQQAQQALNRPTINQLQQQSMFPSFGQTAPVSTTPTLLQPSLTGGGLAQPLIVAPATTQPYMQAATTTTTTTATPNLFPQLGGFGMGASPFGSLPPQPTAASNAPAGGASTNPFLMM